MEGRENNSIKAEILYYPKGYALFLYEPYRRKTLIFQDSLQEFIEMLGYEIQFFDSETEEENSGKIPSSFSTKFLCYNPLDNSLLLLDVDFILIKLDRNKSVYMADIKGCSIIDDFGETKFTAALWNLINIYPKKLDILELYSENSEPNTSKRKTNSIFHPRPTLKLL